MTQEDVFSFLKKNKGRKFSVKDLERELGLRERTVYRCIEGLSKRNDVIITQAQVGESAHITKLYSFVELDDFDGLMGEVKNLKARLGGFVSSEVCAILLLISEIRKLREVKKQ